MPFVAFLSTFLLFFSHSVPFKFLHFDVLVRHANVTAVNDDETNDEVDYLLIAPAKADCLVGSLDSTSAVPRRFCHSVLLRGLTSEIFSVLNVIQKFPFCNPFLIVKDKMIKNEKKISLSGLVFGQFEVIFILMILIFLFNPPAIFNFAPSVSNLDPF